MIVRIVALLLALVVVANAAEWQKLENCQLVADEYGDGDSFHVRQGDKDFIFRLHFVDCPETDNRFPERVEEHAKYFDVTPTQALALGERAAGFTRGALRNPFTVWTKWQDARGASKQHRFYAVVITPTGDLAPRACQFRIGPHLRDENEDAAQRDERGRLSFDDAANGEVCQKG